jgi:hypothetical protein
MAAVAVWFDVAARMQDKTEAAKTRFWDRKDIQGAVRVLDVWGTVKWHWRLGGQGVPTMDWIDMTDERFVRIEQRGRTWIEEAKNPAVKPDGRLAPAFLLTLGVDAVLGEFGSPPALHGLLAHRYPTDGPLARTEAQREYRLYRPPEVVALVGNLRGRNVEWRLDQVLGALERDFVEHLAYVGLRR